MTSKEPAAKETGTRDPVERGLELLRKRLIAMARLARESVERAISVVLEPNKVVAQNAKQLDEAIDQLEIEIDQLSIEILSKAPIPREVQEIVIGMKLSRELERVGDEATTILRRSINLHPESGPKPEVDIPLLTRLPLQMLNDAIQAFTRRDAELARSVIPRDAEVDSRNKQLHRVMASYMVENPATITPCLNMMVVSKSLERIADHATNIAEEVVFLCEGKVIRHSGLGKAASESTAGRADQAAQIRIGPLLVNVPNHQASVEGEAIELTATEFKLLVVLARRVGRVQTRDQLLQDVWEYERFVETRTVDTHIRRLRRKLGAAAPFLQTLRGVGYRFIER